MLDACSPRAENVTDPPVSAVDPGHSPPTVDRIPSGPAQDQAESPTSQGSFASDPRAKPDQMPATPNTVPRELQRPKPAVPNVPTNRIKRPHQQDHTLRTDVLKVSAPMSAQDKTAVSTGDFGPRAAERDEQPLTSTDILGRFGTNACKTR